MAANAVEAQSPPMLEWQYSSWSTARPPGYTLTNPTWGPGEVPGNALENTISYTATPHGAITQTRDESGGEWLYKQIEIHNANGSPIGYMAVGYTQYVNWVQDDGCTPAQVVLPRPDPLVLIERPERRRGSCHGLLARYDLNGQRLWFKSFAPGIFFDLIQDSEGNFVVAGSASNLLSSAGVPAHIIRFNPNSDGTADPISDLASHQCDPGRAGLMTVIKFNLDGEILWDHLYSPFDDLPEALSNRTEGHGLIETHLNGHMGYKVVGFGTTFAGTARQVFVANLDGSGLVKSKTLYASVPGSTITDTFDSEAMRICRAPVSTGEYYAISGFRLMSNTEHSSAFLWVLHEDQDLYLKDTRNATEFPSLLQGLDQNSNGVCFQIQNGTPYVVWPVLGNFTTNGTASGETFASNHQAEAYVYKYGLDGIAPSTWNQPVDLALARGFDLQFNVTPTSDGNLAFATTKWSDSFVAPGNPYGWDDLSPAVQSYVTDPVNGLGYDATGPVEPGLVVHWQNLGWTSLGSAVNIVNFPLSDVHHVYGFWNTDSYVAKLDGTTGALIWGKQWDEETGASATGWPGNFRQRQCNFNIIETYDGGLMVCGNEGHNFDDAYLAKLRGPCAFTVDATIDQACSTGETASIDLTTTGGTGPYGYLWSNGATTEDISSLLPGTYSVIVSDQGDGGCTTDEAYSYTVYPPFTWNIIQHYPCVDGSSSAEAIVTGGSGEFSYLWYYGQGGSVFGIGPTFTPPFAAPAISPWTCEVTDLQSGCADFSSAVHNPPIGVPFVGITSQITAASCASGEAGGINISLPPTFAPYTFLWSNGATTEDVSLVTGGTYSVTASFGLSCVKTYSFTVPETNPCCPASEIIPNGAYSSTYGSGFSNITIDIIGEFLVNNDFTITGGTVYMEPGAEIIVQPGASFRIGGSTVESCKGIMWKSITANEDTYVHLSNCIVRDAENVVVAKDHSTIKLAGNQFIDNRVTLQIPADQDAPLLISDVALRLTGNQFSSSGTLAQPYPGQTTAVGSVGYAAVDANNTSFVDLGGGDNVIDNMSNGIVGHRGNLEIEGFIFRHVRPDPTYSFAVNGAAIFAQGGHGDFKLGQHGYGTGTANFDDCYWGIFTDRMTVFSEQNNMQGMSTAYRIDRSASQYVDIVNNVVSTRYHGMDFRMNDGAKHFLVQNNDITFGYGIQTPWGAFPPCMGIIVSEGNGNNPDSKIINNTIRYWPKLSSFCGLLMMAADRWLIAENELKMASNALNRYGITTYGCQKVEVSCNQTTGAGTTYPDDRQTAIYNNMGEAGLFSCNVMDQTTNGMLFNGYAYETELRGNQFHQHKWGLHLSANAFIGGQPLKGNLWYNEPASGGLSAWYEPINAGQPNPNAYNNPFLYNPAIISGGNTEPPSWLPEVWFQQLNDDNYDCANDQGANYCSQFYAVRSNGEINALDQQIAQDSLQNAPYTAETQWTLKGGLYQKLDDNPALRDSLPDMAAFYNDLQGSATAAFKAVDDGQLALYDMDSTVVVQLQANRTQIENYMALVKAGMAGLDDSTLTAAQVDSIIASLSGYRQNINTLITWNNTALEVARTSKALTADGVKEANANIGTTELIEENEKVVNEIYLSVIAKEVDTFTVDQANTLYSIANQCPMVGGNAVYKARSMYRLINDTITYDDQLLCLPHGIIVKSVRQVGNSIAGVVPNPAKDQAALVLMEQLDTPVVFVMFNSVGVEVMRHSIPAFTTRYTFSTAALAPAVFHYRVRGPSGLIGQGKLAIIK